MDMDVVASQVRSGSNIAVIAVGFSTLAPIWLMFVLSVLNARAKLIKESIYSVLIRYIALVMIPLRLAKCLDATGEGGLYSVCTRQFIHTLSLDLAFVLIACFLNMILDVVYKMKRSSTPIVYPVLVFAGVTGLVGMNEMYSVLICLNGCYETYLSVANFLRFIGAFVVTTLTGLAMLHVYHFVKTHERSQSENKVQSSGKSATFKLAAFLPWAIPHFTLGLALFLYQGISKAQFSADTLADANYNGSVYEVCSVIMSCWGTLEALFYTWHPLDLDAIFFVYVKWNRAVDYSRTVGGSGSRNSTSHAPPTQSSVARRRSNMLRSQKRLSVDQSVSNLRTKPAVIVNPTEKVSEAYGKDNDEAKDEPAAVPSAKGEGGADGQNEESGDEAPGVTFHLPPKLTID